MNEDSQLLVPEAFVRLHTDPLRQRLTLSREELLQRFEFCEDLAHLLTEQAAEQKFRTGLEEVDVLARIRAGLLDDAVGLPEPEVQWVVGRVGELLGW